MSALIDLEKPGTTPVTKSVKKSDMTSPLSLNDVLPQSYLKAPVADENIDPKTLQAVLDARRGIGVTTVNSFLIK